MNKMRIDTTTDEVGALRIQIPGQPHRYRVHVTVEWDAAATGSSEWPPGWVDLTAGSIDDPSFARHSSHEYEPREELG